MEQELIRLAGLSKFYTGNQSVVMGLNGLNLSFFRGEFVAITGESGSGKSTLSHVLSGIVPYESGELYFRGEPTSHFDSADWERYRRDHISFISQNYGILPGATVLENVVSALLLTGVDWSDAQEKARALLEQVELWDMKHRRAAKLSSGQKQRLSIARALAKPAPVLIADEPTGNLDPENSAKVIALLSKAAEDRLVILVTHEFPEAEAYATRHIVLQEGRVAMDAALRPVHKRETTGERVRAERPVSLYIAGLQQRSRPVWSVFVSLFFALTAFAVFAFLGTFMVHLDDSSTRVYDPSVFKNGDPLRIVAVTMDGRPMTEEDYHAIANVDHVQMLEPNGYVSDLQYAYRENVDYELVTYETLTTGAGGIAETQVHVYAKLFASAPYLRTVPVLPDGEQLLTSGREPENLYEVVANGDKALLGETVTVYLSNPDYWPADQTLRLEMTVVGVTDMGSGLYFHEDLGRLCTQISKTAIGGYVFLPAGDLNDGQFRAHWDVVSGMLSQYDRTRREIGRSHKMTELPLREMKTFENINYDPYGETETEQSVTLEIVSEVQGGYYLWNLTGMRYLCYDPDTGLWCAEDSQAVVSGSEYCVEFYPVDGTEKAQDGTLTSGRYVIWNTTERVALSGVREKSSASGIYYRATPVEMHDGVLTGYTTDNVWDVEIAQGQIVSITQNDAYLIARTGGQSFARYWVSENAKVPIGVHGYDQTRLIEVSYDRFDQLTWKKSSEQVSLTITDYGYAQRVLEQVQELGYAALSPYQLGSVKQDADLAQEREQTLLICLLALLAVAALQILLLRALFAVQMDSYRLLSNLGLSAAMARRSVFWQILIFVAVGQLLSIVSLMFCWDQGVERIVHIIHYLPPEMMILLVAVHVLIAALGTLWVCRALNRQVYALTGRTSDLDMEEEGAEAEA